MAGSTVPSYAFAIIWDVRRSELITVHPRSRRELSSVSRTKFRLETSKNKSGILYDLRLSSRAVIDTVDATEYTPSRDTPADKKLSLKRLSRETNAGSFAASKLFR